MLYFTGSYITNRVFAVQVICGPIDYLMYVCVDQLISGGANLAIEVQRLGQYSFIYLFICSGILYQSFPDDLRCRS